MPKISLYHRNLMEPMVVSHGATHVGAIVIVAALVKMNFVIFKELAIVFKL